THRLPDQIECKAAAVSHVSDPGGRLVGCARADEYGNHRSGEQQPERDGDHQLDHGEAPVALHRTVSSTTEMVPAAAGSPKDCSATLSAHVTVIVAVTLLAPVFASGEATVTTLPAPFGSAVARAWFHRKVSFCATCPELQPGAAVAQGSCAGTTCAVSYPWETAATRFARMASSIV